MRNVLSSIGRGWEYKRTLMRFHLVHGPLTSYHHISSIFSLSFLFLSLLLFILNFSTMKFVTHFYFLSLYSFLSSFFSHIIFSFIFFSLRKYASVSRCYLQKRNCWAGKSWYVRSIFLRHKGLHLLILLLFHFSFQNSFFLFLLFFHYFYISLILFIKTYFVFICYDVVHVNSVADFNLFFIIILLRYNISISSVT